MWNPSLAHLVQSFPQSHLARNQFLSQVVVLLLQTVACLLESTVFPLRVKNKSLSEKGSDSMQTLVGDFDEEVPDF